MAIEQGRRRHRSERRADDQLAHLASDLRRQARSGNWSWDPRHGERRLSRADQKVIDLVAAPLAIVLHAQALTEDLKASRERVIDAAEEERTRLRRELHDSLGPLLTGAAFKADGIALSRPAPTRAGRIVGGRAGRSAAAVRRGGTAARVRTPSQLRWMSSGWLGALREEGSRFGLITVTIDAPEFMPALPSSVEVAAYRIAAEALTNVVRHSDAKLASVRLTADDGAARDDHQR